MTAASLEEAAHKRAMEAEEAAHSFALDLKAKEAEEKEKEPRHNLELIEKQKQLRASSVIASTHRIPKWDQLCLAYNETDCIEEYFTWLYKSSEVQEIPKAKRVCTLITQLSGKA